MSEISHLLPGWLAALLTEKFFSACLLHEDDRKNEKNMFCLDCCVAICPHCLNLHGSHRVLQIRRYIYHDVLRLRDAVKLLDSDSVQSYISNGEKVVFLNQRPITRPCRSSAKPCITCDRAVQASFDFCSIFCKLQGMIKAGVRLSDHICNWESLVLPEPGLGDDQMTPETVLEPPASTSADSASSANGSHGGWFDCRIFASTATTEIVRKKRSSLSSFFRSEFRSAVAVNQRKNLRKKGIPHRSPLH